LAEQEYFNFISSINSPATKKTYSFRLQEFLTYCKLDFHKFLRNKNSSEQTNLITAYLAQKKVSKPTKNLIFYAIKHACVMNDILLNWPKIHKFIKAERTGNESLGKDRGYTHEEISKIIEFSDQRLKTCFLILASTGMRIGALGLLRIADLERIEDLYKVVVYSSDKEQYITFTTPEASKEVDAYLEYRKRRGEKIGRNSFLIVKRMAKNIAMSEPFKGDSLRALLKDCIERSGIRQIEHIHRHRRKEVALMHGFRKFTTKQLVDSKVTAEVREMLLGHDIGLIGRYYKPTEKDLLQEYYKAVPALTISNEERLKYKLEERITIEKTKIQSLTDQFEAFKKEVSEMKRRKK
jgi:integrase